MFQKSLLKVIYIASLLLLLVYLHPLTRSLEAIVRSPELANGQAPALQNQPTASNLSTVSAPLPSLIVIDPGHGGDDPGAPSVVGIPEKDITLAVSLKIATDLRRKGYRVELTRTTDTNYSLADRLSLSLQSDRPDYYLSVHANSYDAASVVRGMEIHIYDPRKYTNPKYPGIPAAAKASQQSKKIAKSIVESIESHPTGIPVRRLTGQADGIRYDADYLIRLNPIPSALIELGYLSNPLDAKLLTDSDVQALYAKDIADGIAEVVPDSQGDEASDERNTS